MLQGPPRRDINHQSRSCRPLNAPKLEPRNEKTGRSPVVSMTCIVRLPSKAYLECAARTYRALARPDPKLVILDLNGTLVWRPERSKTTRIPKLRLGMESFLPFLFDNFHVMIWSSSSPASVSTMVQYT